MALLAALALASPASAGTGSDLSGVIARAEQLRGLRTTHPLAVSAVTAAGMRRIVTRELAHERQPRSDAAWDDALHLLGVLERGQSLAQVQRRQLTGQVAGVYIPRSGRLYVLGAGGNAPRSVIAHEVVHALQDEHFDLTHGASRRTRATTTASSPRSRSSRAMPRTCSRATSPPLSAGDLVGELARTLGAVPAGSAAGTPPYLERQLLFPYTAGEAFVRALRAHGGQRLLDRAFAHPPRTSAAVLDPARWIAGDPPPQAVPLPAGTFTFTSTFGAEDVAALTGEGRARARLAGRAPGALAQGPRPAPGEPWRGARGGGAEARSAALGARRVPRPPRVRAHRAHKRFSAGAFLPIGTAWSHPQGAVRQRALPSGDCTQSSTRLACTCTAARRLPTIASSRRSR